ncbi:hypothetical protein CsSME_00009026 [Camellia sinensis var. sinensis]
MGSGGWNPNLGMKPYLSKKVKHFDKWRGQLLTTDSPPPCPVSSSQCLADRILLLQDKRGSEEADHLATFSEFFYSLYRDGFFVIDTTARYNALLGRDWIGSPGLTYDPKKTQSGVTGKV